MTREWSFREFVAFVLMAMFGWMLFKNPSDPIIIGALLTAFAAAWGFYLGGSKVGADTATKNADTLSNQAAANVPTAEPQQVEVVNEPSNPVPTAEGKP